MLLYSNAPRRVDNATINQVPEAVMSLLKEGEFAAKVSSAGVWIFDMEYSAKPILAQNVYTGVGNEVYGRQSGEVMTLRDTFKESCKLRFFVLGSIVNDHVKTITDAWENERITHPLSK